MNDSRPPNPNPVIFKQTQGHFFCKFCTPHGVEDKNLMDVFEVMNHATRIHRIENLYNLGEFVRLCGFVQDWEILQRKAAKVTPSECKDKKNQSKRDDDNDDDDFKYGPSNPGAPSYSTTLKQSSSTAAPSHAAGAPSNPPTSSVIANTMNPLPMNFPYVTCDRCRKRNRECHLDVFGQHCADCYCIGRKCFVNRVHTRGIWRDYAVQYPGAKASWVTPNYHTEIPDRQKRRKVAAGKKGMVDAVKGPLAE